MKKRVTHITPVIPALACALVLMIACLAGAQSGGGDGGDGAQSTAGPSDTWPQIKAWIQNQLAQDRIITPPVTLARDPGTFKVPAEDAVLLRRYLWLHSQFGNIALVFGRGLSDAIGRVIEALRAACFADRLRAVCGAPLAHREALLDQFSSPRVEW